ncbi:protein-tyrosine-phosphatase [Auraticoccus sp. F435]|uniref:Protein-tyrosine-phosphatase n=1 Tax=Auraticoccus cholistanensis TaxID=2656650 RepID=A0A6A9UU61_9ACTN|nr:protein-tyrosine-phosphatase [Auraticoccus cholistanensis]
MQREQEWDGYPNVRDLGGLPTPHARNGWTTFGRVFRGPRPELLTQEGWAALQRAGVRTLVDLRNADERGRRSDDPVLEGPPSSLTVLHRPLEDHDHEEFMRSCGAILDSPEYYPHNLRLLPQLVSDALRAVAAAGPGGVLVHCAAGRDRTGLLTSLLLVVAGVASGTVADDYELGVRAVEAEAVAGRSREAPRGAGLEEWVRTSRSWLLRFLEELEPGRDPAEHGLPTIGLDAATCRVLRERLTS